MAAVAAARVRWSPNPNRNPYPNPHPHPQPQPHPQPHPNPEPNPTPNFHPNHHPSPHPHPHPHPNPNPNPNPNPSQVAGRAALLRDARAHAHGGGGRAVVRSSPGTASRELLYEDNILDGVSLALSKCIALAGPGACGMSAAPGRPGAGPRAAARARQLLLRRRRQQRPQLFVGAAEVHDEARLERVAQAGPG